MSDLVSLDRRSILLAESYLVLDLIKHLESEVWLLSRLLFFRKDCTNLGLDITRQSALQIFTILPCRLLLDLGCEPGSH